MKPSLSNKPTVKVSPAPFADDQLVQVLVGDVVIGECCLSADWEPESILTLAKSMVRIWAQTAMADMEVTVCA